jgi:ribosomal protein S18 acetylase RimI-like enzyme
MTRPIRAPAARAEHRVVMTDLPIVRLRAITAADAEAVVRMWSEFARYLRQLGDTDTQGFGIEAFLRDGFGPDPAFSGIIAERGGDAVGYLLYHFGYDVDQGARVMYVADLWVDPAARRGGVGRALMREAAARCRAKGGLGLTWAVFAANKLAADFYARLGGELYTTLNFMHISAGDL